jgi:hypothetical protein
MNVEKTSAITIKVNDMDMARLVHFYNRRLGLKVLGGETLTSLPFGRLA